MLVLLRCKELDPVDCAPGYRVGLPSVFRANRIRRDPVVDKTMSERRGVSSPAQIIEIVQIVAPESRHTGRMPVDVARVDGNRPIEENYRIAGQVGRRWLGKRLINEMSPQLRGSLGSCRPAKRP